jgi:hypothetical protein
MIFIEFFNNILIYLLKSLNLKYAVNLFDVADLMFVDL